MTRFSLYELRKIALGEFLDDLDLGNIINDIFGIDSGAAASDDNQVKDIVGEERLEHNGQGVFSSFGPTFIIASSILLCFIVIVLILIICLRKRNTGCCDKCKRCINYITTKLFFNPLIRYLLLNALKFYMASMINFKTDHDDNSVDRVFAIAILIIINVIALYFSCLLHRNKTQLGQESSINRYGTLYQGREIKEMKHPLYLQPLAFFLRRLLFSVVTVYLFDKPQM